MRRFVIALLLLQLWCPPRAAIGSAVDIPMARLATHSEPALSPIEILAQAPGADLIIAQAVHVKTTDPEGINAFADVELCDFAGALPAGSPANQIGAIVMPGTFDIEMRSFKDGVLSMRLWGSLDQRWNPRGIGLDMFRTRPYGLEFGPKYWAIVGLLAPSGTWSMILVPWILPESK